MRIMNPTKTSIGDLRYFVVAITIILLFIATLLRAEAQTHHLTGTIHDVHKDEVIGANVVLLSEQGKQITGTTSSATGQFQLRNLSAGNYTLRVSYVGYKDYLSPIRIPHSGALEITLEEDSQLLNTVTIEARASDMTIKGDTVVFNANAYHVGEGAVLEDLIKRIPGAEVNASGDITINGKSVDKILVEGKEFFSGDTKVATKNLPAEVIDKLELLDRSSDASRMTGFNDGDDETVLNLSFKSSHKKGLFGNLFAGYGTNNRYEANATINNFSGENRITVIAGSNNTNNRGSDELDSDSGGGGFRRRDRPDKGVASGSSIAGDIAWSILPNLQLEGNGRYNYTDRQVLNDQMTEELRSGSPSLFSQEHQDLRSFSHNAGSQLRFTYKIDSLTEAVLRPSFWWNKTYDIGSNSTATWEDANNPISRSTTQYTTDEHSLWLGGNLDISRKLNSRGRVLSLGLRGGYNGNNDEGQYQAAFTGGAENNNRNLKLSDDNRTTSGSIRLSYVEPLSSKLFLQALGEWRRNHRQGNREVFTPDNEGKYSILNEEFSSHFTNKLNAYQGAINLQFRTSEFDITAGLGLEFSQMQTQYLDQTWKNDQVFLVPNARMNYQPDKQTSWRLDYRARSEMPQVAMMIPTVDPTDLRRITEGNSQLKPTVRHEVRSFFRSFNPNSRLAINLFMNANYELNGVASVVRYDNTTGQQHISYRNVDGNTSVGMFGMGSMPFLSPLLTLNVGFRGHYNHQNGYITDTRTNVEQLNVSNYWSLGPSLGLSFAKGDLYLRLRNGFTYGTTLNSLQGQPQRTTWDYDASLEGSYRLPFGIKLESDIRYQTNHGYGADYKKSAWLWNAALSYSFLRGQAATIRIKGYDLLGSETGISRNVTALNVTDSRTNVLGRYFMIHFIYRFSSFASGSSRGDFGNRGFDLGPR